MTTETTPGRAAYEAGGLGLNDAPWSALTAGDRHVWEEAAAAAIDANLTAADDGTLTAAGRLADVLGQLAEAQAERDRLRNACKHMGSVIVSMSRQMECARIEMLQNGPERAMQWILNGLPDVDDNPPGMRWDGKESADEWFERTADYARSEAAK